MKVGQRKVGKRGKRVGGGCKGVKPSAASYPLLRFDLPQLQDLPLPLTIFVQLFIAWIMQHG